MLEQAVGVNADGVDSISPALPGVAANLSLEAAEDVCEEVLDELLEGLDGELHVERPEGLFIAEGDASDGEGFW